MQKHKKPNLKGYFIKFLQKTPGLSIQSRGFACESEQSSSQGVFSNMNPIPAYPGIPALLRAAEQWRKGNAYELKTLSWHPEWSENTHSWIVAGLYESIQRFQSWIFPPAMIHYLGNLRTEAGGMLFHESFLNHLQRWSPKVSLQCLPEGSVYEGEGPLFTLEGPIMELSLAKETLVREVPPLCQFAGSLSVLCNQLNPSDCIQWPNSGFPIEDGYWVPAFKAAGIATTVSWSGYGQLKEGAESWKYAWPVIDFESSLSEIKWENEPCWIPVEKIEELECLPSVYGCYGSADTLSTHLHLLKNCTSIGIVPPVMQTRIPGIAKWASPSLAGLSH